MSNAPILVIKRPKRFEHGHHGGQWKVAYADFVTAMMAFFLLLWLLNSVSDEQLIGISNYFSPISPPSASGGGGSVLSGRTIAVPAPVGEGGTKMADGAGPGSRADATTDGESEEETRETEKTEKTEETEANLSETELDELVAEREQEQFLEAAKQLRETVEGSPEFASLASHLMVSDTPEGLHIQIMDQEGLPMFPRGSAEMNAYTKELLKVVADVIHRMPQEVAITGHTDATPFATDAGYGNWELSADRANAARRVLEEYGVPEARISRVVGKADTEPLMPEDPEAPANRRLSVVLLRSTSDREPVATPEH